MTVDYSWGYTMPCKKHYSYTWTKGYGSDRLNAGGDEDLKVLIHDTIWNKPLSHKFGHTNGEKDIEVKNMVQIGG